MVNTKTLYTTSLATFLAVMMLGCVWHILLIQNGNKDWGIRCKHQYPSDTTSKPGSVDPNVEVLWNVKKNQYLQYGTIYIPSIKIPV